MATLKDSVKMQPLTVTQCESPNDWDQYVSQHSWASSYHSWAWKRVIEQTFGHHTAYLAASSGGTIQGVLPLVRMRSRLFGHFLTSMPFVNYGGVLASSPEAE